MPKLNFQSGPWRGFYNYRAGGSQHRMDLALTFSNGKISGGGSDDIGKFDLRGAYEGSSGECSWEKIYFGAHTVHYRGFRENKGICGVWKIRSSSGGFHGRLDRNKWRGRRSKRRKKIVALW